MAALSNDPALILRDEDLDEKYPSEMWSFFTNHDLTQLIADACDELYRRHAKIQVRFG